MMPKVNSLSRTLLRPVSALLFLLIAFGPLSPGPAHPQGPGRQQTRLGKTGALTLEVFDANSRHTSGVFLPVSAYTPSTLAPLASDPWTASARPVSKVAADGVTLLLLRTKLPAGYSGPVHFRLDHGQDDGDQGSLWRVDDGKLVDLSAQGGARDSSPPGQTQQITVKTVLIGGDSYAFALYRAPRNFDPDKGQSTWSLRERTAQLCVDLPGQENASDASQTLTIVRPLVVFVHGTYGSKQTWVNFPLWENSANEVNNYRFDNATLPFYAGRVAFDDFLGASGPVVETAQVVLPRINAALQDWETATGIAGTQAEVITHSFGGFVMRMVAQTQPDPDPLAGDDSRNFRAASNWGHGTVHKLITLAATHRGSAEANHLAYLNHFGHTPGQLRIDAIADQVPIDNGAVRDQMVLSPALRSLQETRVPGHSVAGSGLVRFAVADGAGLYAIDFWELQNYDVEGGPYNAAGPVLPGGNPDYCAFNRLTNYVFNLDYDTPPLGPSPNCDLVPDYDLTVSEWSSRGLMPRAAFTDVFDLDPTGALVGRLYHTKLHDSPAVSERVVFLLHQPTTGPFFSFFPAVLSVPPSPLESRFSEGYDPAWLYE